MEPEKVTDFENYQSEKLLFPKIYRIASHPIHIFKYVNNVIFPESFGLVKREHTSCFLTVSFCLFISHLFRIAIGHTDGAEWAQATTWQRHGF